MNTALYNSCKLLIANNRYSSEDIVKKISVFLQVNALTKEEHDELIDMVKEVL